MDVVAEMAKVAINPDACLGRKRFQENLEVSVVRMAGIKCRHALAGGLVNSVQKLGRGGLEVHKNLLSCAVAERG